MTDRPDLFDALLGSSDDGFADMRRHTASRHPARRHPMPCPPLAVLLAYADETDTSITPRRRLRIREHVHCCETCFTYVELAFRDELQGVAEMLRYDHAINQPEVRRREANFQEALRDQIKRTTPPLRSHHRLMRGLSIAATIAVIAAGLMFLRPAVVVIDAEELIERAMAYERQQAVESAHARNVRRVRQSLAAPTIARGPRPVASDVPAVAPFSEIRDVVDGEFSADLQLSSGRERAAHAALARLFARYRFDLRKPFCLTCYRAWRASLSRPRDTVTVTGDIIHLRTTSSEGSLREVTSDFDRRSSRIVRQTFLFEGLGRLAFEELERHAAPANQRASAARRAAVDGGDGTIAPPVTSRPPAAGDLARGTRAPRMPLSRWVDRTFSPLNSARATFLPELERRSSSVRQHLIVLQRLASVSAGGKVKNATDEERTKLFQQVELEYQAVVTHLRALEERLNLLLGTGTRAAEFRTTVPADWQRRASTALPHATRLEHRLRRIFAHDDLPRGETDASRPRSARAAFEALWASIHGNQRAGTGPWVPN